jgi:hypothetical protein
MAAYGSWTDPGAIMPLYRWTAFERRVDYPFVVTYGKHTLSVWPWVEQAAPRGET